MSIRACRWSLLAFCIAVSACVRDIPDLPDPFEGGELTGTVEELTAGAGAPVPAEGVRVHVRGRSGGVWTNAQGRFQLNRLPLGPVELEAERRDGSGLIVAAGASQLMVDGASVEVGTIDISRNASVFGPTQRLEDGQLVDAPGTIVVLAGTPFRTISTAGSYLLGPVPSGDFDVVGFQAGYAPVRGRVTLEAYGSASSAFLFTETSTASPVPVAGRVALEDGSQVSANVTFIAASGVDLPDQTVLSETSGDWTAQVSAGLYHVLFEQPGYIPYEQQNVAVIDAHLVLGLEPEVTLAAVPQADLDGDGIPDGQDADRDGDGCANADDAFPDDPTVCRDLDRDGRADHRDADRDGDGRPDPTDPCPEDDDPSCVAPDMPEDQNFSITGISPTRARVGDFIRIEGAAFTVGSEPIVRFGSDLQVSAHDYATAMVVTSTYAVTQVPSDALTGLVSVSRGGVWVPAGQLAVDGTLSIRALEPQPVAPEDRLAIYVQGEIEGGVRIRFDDNPAQDPIGCTPSEELAAELGDTVVCAKVPNAARSLVVSTSTSQSRRRDVVVRRAPRFIRLDKNDVLRGETVTALGSNLGVDAHHSLRGKGYRHRLRGPRGGGAGPTSHLPPWPE